MQQGQSVEEPWTPFTSCKVAFGTGSVSFIDSRPQEDLTVSYYVKMTRYGVFLLSFFDKDH